MKATRMLLFVGLGVFPLAAGGCKETYTLHFTNVTNEVQNVTVLDDMGHPDIDGMPVGPAGGKSDCTITQDQDEVRQYTIKANKAETKFVIRKGAKKTLFFRISPNGIIGPAEKVDETWKTETTIPIRTAPKID
jgi:hypothetical protein